MVRVILITGSLLGMLAVILGAFAAHGLKSRVSTDLIAVFKTGVEYQFYHTFAILCIGISLVAQKLDSSRWLTLSFYLFLVGIIFFSGSLYLLALTKIKWFGPITPIGGVFLILGWIFFLCHWLLNY
ncbi:MAG: uncharacterized membrane protein YgdD (TMEM256/DUF423 family) [bacterium]|jgi:uncharacterized membrane protein YgdD (TMEM256/DUF423 family)